jgi:hypothetical protein
VACASNTTYMGGRDRRMVDQYQPEGKKSRPYFKEQARHGVHLCHLAVREP